MFEVVESQGRLEIVSPMPVGRRVLFGLLALFPLLAPYELIFRPHWESYLNLFFLLSALVSAGAVALSVFLAFAAVAGLTSRMTFDAERSAFVYFEAAPAFGSRTRELPLADVLGVEVRTHEWSEGPDTYSLRVTAADGSAFDSISDSPREKAEHARARAQEFLARGA